jgi:hypothetical protein
MIKLIKIRSAGLMISVMAALTLGGCAFDSELSDAAPVMPRDQCRVFSQAEYQKVVQRNFIGKNFALFSKVRHDTKPRGPYVLKNLKFDSSGQPDTMGVLNFNGMKIDAADTFMETSDGTYVNLTKLIDFPSCASQTMKIQQRLLLKR